jgi:hypothetical protein
MGCACRSFTDEAVDQRRDRYITNHLAAHRLIAMNDVLVVPAHPLPRNVASVIKIADEPLRRTFRYPNRLGDLPGRTGRILGNVQ